MKRYLQLALSLAALIAYGTFVCAAYSLAKAETASEACGVDCLVRRVDALNGKTAALEHTVEQLTAQVGKSIKSGQTVTSHTPNRRGRRLPYLRWSEWRTRRLRILEFKLHARHVVDD